ncbi:MerR family transcriptional regulator [Phaeacidiphilus oryzae]|uniref:MerR family transcriptional regulator n=1 Tax=Phaeacidiphilus oryzae TaxID=348818 RepID=UPI0005637A35|nr:MerR family transcriptional regulator [Phaeacidiphilus oryzae]
MDEDVSGPGVTTGALARRVGVSPTTLRSWDRRYGLGPQLREGGRHRRWSAQDVARVEAMCRLTAEGIPPAEAARAALASASPASASPAAASPAASASPSPVASAASTGDGARRTAPAGPPADRGAPADRAAPAGAPSPAEARREARGLSRAAVRLDGPAIQRTLDALVERYGVVPAWEQVMVPTLHAVGRRWAESEDRCVEIEHLLSWHVGSSLRRAPRLREEAAGRPPVVAGCVPGELHSLALEALVAALGERAVPVRMLGAAVPAGALEAAVRRTGPCAVVLWSQTRSSANLPLASGLARMTWGVRGARSSAAVAVGGPGWAGRAQAGLLRPGSLGEAVDQLTELSRSRAH